MRFQTTLDIWTPAIQRSIETGVTKLQRGQWLRCGTSRKRCRFVGVTSGGSIWVTHWQGTPGATEAKFRDAVRAFTKRGH